MIAQPWQDIGIENIFPDSFLPRQGPAQQGVDPTTINGAEAFTGRFIPISFMLPGIIGQADVSTRSGKEHIPTRRAGNKVHPHGRLHDAIHAVSVLAKRWQHSPLDINCGQRVANIALQDRVWTDLDKNTASILRQSDYCVLKFHGFPHVVPPIQGIQTGAIDNAAHDRRHKNGLIAWARSKIFQIDQKAFPGAIHMAAVKGVIKVQKLEVDIFRLEVPAQTLHAFNAAGKRDHVRAVDGGNGHIKGPAERLQNFSGGFAGQGGCSHFAQPSRNALCSTAMNDDTNGLLQGQRTRGPGCSHLSNTMPGHSRRPDPLLFQKYGQGDLDGKKQRLCYDGIIQARFGLDGQ